MFFLNRNGFKFIRKFSRLYSFVRKNHYEVLKIRKDCSDKEIKEAFIQLSKEYHPDKNKDAKAQEKFVNIVEAYNVLSKPSSRARYDSIIEIPTGSSFVYRTHVPYNLRKNPQYSYYYASQAKAGPSENSSFYGMSATKKVPNYVVIAFCTGVALLGILLQVFVIRNMYLAQRRQAHEKSQHNAKELEKVRAAAEANGNELQARLLLDKIVSAANPSVATASLGQSLAKEKK